MRWSDEQLEQHLKTHQMRKNEGFKQLKKKNDAKVRQAHNQALEAKLQRNTTGGENTI